MIKTISRLVEQTEIQNTRISQIIQNEEVTDTGLGMEDIRLKMKRRLEVMKQSADLGTSTPTISISGMSGGNAFSFSNWLTNHRPLTGDFLSKAIARAIGVSEVNASMGRIVATPTAGSAGILPGVLLTLQEFYGFSDDQLVDALFTAGGIGNIIANKATLAGAAGGCQAETGAAAAMSAAAAVELMGGSPMQSAHAVAITITNMLGLVCDPVAGLVEVPCVKRNAGAVAQCLVAVDLSLAGIESIIPADEVIDAMSHVGKSMDHRLKETAEGGIAATPTGRAWAKRLWTNTDTTATNITEQNDG